MASLIAAGLLGCGGGASITPVSPIDASPTPRETPATPPTGPAFVLYTSRHTLVVPIATGAPIAQGKGIWVLDDAATLPGVQVFLGDVPEGLPPCVDLDKQTACEALPLPFEAGPVCTCVRVKPDPTFESGDALDEGGGMAEDEPGCATMSTSPAALVGGKLYTLGGSNTMCGGVNVYDAAGADFAMVAEPFTHASFGPQLTARGCTARVPAGEPAPASDHDRLECASPGQAPREDEPEQCDDCDRLSPEAQTWVLWRGRLVRIEDNIFHAGGARWVSDVRVAPGRCPTAADACGPSGLYPGLDGSDGYWIATDGSAALTLEGRRVRIRRPGGRAHAPFDLPGGEVIGVRFHRDARALLTALKDGAPHATPPPVTR